MPGFLLNKYVIGALGIAALVITICFMKLHMDNLALERDAAVKARDAYQNTLAAYQDQYAAQVHELNSEKGREIIRQENLLKTLNLIGDIDESENVPISNAGLRVIDSLYGQAQ